MVLTISLIAIIGAIIVGWKMKVNPGLLAMGLAFIIMVFLMGGRVSTVINYFPVRIVFFLLAIGLFFNYATSNGTMDVLSKHLLHALHGNAKLIPWVIAVTCAVVAFMGAGAATPAIIGPIAFAIGLAAGLNPILIAIFISCATLMGGDNPINGFGGVISTGLIADTIYGDHATSMGMMVWLNSCIKQIIIMVIAYFVFKGYKANKVVVDKPEPFSPLQKKQLTVMIVALALMVIPAILNAWVKAPFIKTLAQICQPQSVMIIGAFVSVMLKLGNEKEIIHKLPMNTILLIAGMYMLLKVAQDAGMTDAIANIMSNNIPKILVPVALVGFSAFLSFFSSGTSVVCPLLYPMVPGLATAMGLNPVMLFSCVFIGAMSSAISPFSTGGAMVVAGCPDEKIKDQLSISLVPVAIIIPIICAILAFLGVFNLFSI